MLRHSSESAYVKYKGERAEDRRGTTLDSPGHLAPRSLNADIDALRAAGGAGDLQDMRARLDRDE